MGAAREAVERNGGRGLYPGVFLLGGRAGKVTEAMPTEGTKNDRGHTKNDRSKKVWAECR